MPGRRRRQDSSSGRPAQRRRPNRMPRPSRPLTKAGELKRVFHYNAGTGFTNAWALAPPTAGATYPLNGPTVGTSDEQRIGREIHAKSIHIQGYITFARLPNVGDETQFVKIVLVKDSQANAGAPTPTSVYEDRTVSTNNIIDFRHSDYVKRYQVIADLVLSRHSNFDRAYKVPFRIDRQLNFKCEFSGTGGTYSDFVTNSLSMMIVGSPGVASSLTWQSMFKFVE
jgi:hypothetical protein